MPRVQISDGRVIEFPDGMSQDAMAKALQSLPPVEPKEAPQQPGAPGASTGPLAAVGGLFSGAKDAAMKGLNMVDTMGGLMKVPGQMQREGKLNAPSVMQDPRSAVPQTGGQLLSGAANAIPGLGPLASGARLAAAGGLGAAGNALTGHDPASGAGEALLGQGPGEGLSGLGALAGKLASGRAALKDFRAKQDFDKQFHSALSTLDERQASALRSEYEAARGEHAKNAAAGIVDNIVAKVPTLKGLPRDEKGLADIVAGGAQAKVSEMYDKSLKDVVSRGQGKMVSMDVDDARKLGFKNMRTHRVAPSGRGIEPNETVEVDAGELASRLPGFWKKDAKIYRRGVEALDTAGVGDPAARAEYSAFQGAAQFLDAAKAFKNGKFDPDRLDAALYDLKKVNLLRKRGLGDVSSGMMQPATGGPLAPKKMEPRPMPPEPVKNFKESPVTAPAAGGMLGGLLGYLGGGAMGHPYIGGHVGAGMGATAGRLLAPHGTPIGPLNPGTAQTLGTLPALMSMLARYGLQGPQGPQGPQNPPQGRPQP